MARQKWTSVFMALIIVLASSSSFGQTNRTIKRNVATVLFASLGGAILGLSTLSFYGEPQEHTDNITVGALLGFAAGVGYVVYDSALPEAPNYDYSQVFDRDIKTRRNFAYQASNPVMQYTFAF